MCDPDTYPPSSTQDLCGNTKLSTGVLYKKYYCGAIKLLQKGYCVHSSQSAAFLKDVEFSPNHHLSSNELWKMISDILWWIFLSPNKSFVVSSLFNG